MSSRWVTQGTGDWQFTDDAIVNIAGTGPGPGESGLTLSQEAIDAIADAVAKAVLATPENKVATDVHGKVKADLRTIKGKAVTCKRRVRILNRVGRYVKPKSMIAESTVKQRENLDQIQKVKPILPPVRQGSPSAARTRPRRLVLPGNTP